jgi:hypothetical protein
MLSARLQYCILDVLVLLYLPVFGLVYLHYTENPIDVFPKMKLRGFVPNSYIHLSVSDLYIPRIALPTGLRQNRQTNPWNI